MINVHLATRTHLCNWRRNATRHGTETRHLRFPRRWSHPAKIHLRRTEYLAAIEWTGTPPQAKSFEIILDDPDAPSGLFTHWRLYNIPQSTHSLEEGYKPSSPTETGANDFGKRGYGGPCPPSGTHRYFFKLFALDVANINVGAGAKRQDVDRALKGHVVDETRYMGKYAKKK